MSTRANPLNPDLHHLLAVTAARHSHLCPRQVLGVRAGLAGAERLALAVPRADKRLLVIVETDGCFADGIEVATGATVGHRTLRVEDYGKIAVTLVDKESVQAVRVTPQPDIRQRAADYAPAEKNLYQIYLHGYQLMPGTELFAFQDVRLTTPLEKIISQEGLRVCCAMCGEEVINERELQVNGQPLCRACAGPAYYALLEDIAECQPLRSSQD